MVGGAGAGLLQPLLPHPCARVGVHLAPLVVGDDSAHNSNPLHQPSRQTPLHSHPPLAVHKRSK